MAMLVLSNT